MVAHKDTPTPAPLDVVIFGGAGDLSWRKLLPALYMAHLHETLEPSARIIGVGRHSWGKAEYTAFVNEKSPAYIEPRAFDQASWDQFLARLDFVAMDATHADQYSGLTDACRAGSTKVFYLSTSPSLFSNISANLHGAGLIDANSRVVLEKPLGHDLPSSQAINEAVAKYFQERQIYRIDHYLGKETVQNLMVLRFGNAMFEPLWRAPYIKSVQITVAETVSVGTRAGFYDHTGAMRDMVQNHLLQLLCIVAMEPPISLDSDDVRDEKLKVLRSLKPMGLADIQRDTVRGQYTAGTVGGKDVPGYLQEDNVPANSQTETFVALKAQIHNARWAGVPFYLRTGKCMPTRRSEIIVEFADSPFSIFADQPTATQTPNRLVIALQPEESIELQMMAKEPGSGMTLRPVRLNLDLQSAFTERRAEAYERLLVDVIKGRLTHFMRRDELEAAWKWADPILEGWKTLNQAPRPYQAGTWGPAASTAMVARDDVTWAEAQ